MSFFSEIKRRSVFRVAIGYIGVSWLIIQVIETLFSIYAIDERIAQVIVTVLMVGFVSAMALAWIFELTPEGIKRDANADPSTPSNAAGRNRYWTHTAANRSPSRELAKLEFGPDIPAVARS